MAGPWEQFQPQPVEQKPWEQFKAEKPWEKFDAPKQQATPAVQSKPWEQFKPEAAPEQPQGNILQRAGHAVADWWNKQPSWAEQAEQYSKSGQEAYKRGGAHAMVMDNLDQGINLAGGLAAGGVMKATELPGTGIVGKLISPGTVSPKAEEAAGMLREAGGTAARDTEKTRAALGQYEAKLNTQTPAEQLDTLAYMEGRSKGAVLEKGKVKAYRGTAGPDDFSDPNRLGGIFFTTDKQYAQQMAERAARARGGKPEVKEYDLDLGKIHPGTTTPTLAREAGSDSMWVGKGNRSDEIVLFDKNRISPSSEGGGLQKFADEFRDAMKLRRTKIENSSRFSQAGMQEDYVRHYWKDQAKARVFMNTWLSKQGSGSSLKKRSIPTIAEGIKAGLEPVTTNPFEIGMRYVTNMDKYIAMDEMLAAGKQAGSVKFFRPGSRNVPDGWKPLSGHLADRQTPVGPMKAHAPDDWARIWNNHVSQGVYRNAELGQAYDAFRFASNTATQTVLGLSGYHMAAMTKEAVHSGMAKAFSQMAGGVKMALSGVARQQADKALRGVVTAAKGVGAVPASLAAPVTRALQGRKFQQVYLGRLPGSPDYRKAVDLFEKAGGRAVGKQHAPDYQFSAGGSYFSAWWRGSLKQELRNAMTEVAGAKNPYGAAAKQTVEAIGRVFETISAPLFKEYIPKLKAGAFYDTMNAWLKANPTASFEEQMVVARKIVDSVDNRFGEMIQDNIFWHTLAKQTATVGMLSYSWNLGTVGEIIGGALATAKGLGKGLDISSAKYDPRVAYVIAYPMAAATINAIYQYLKTGQAPQSPHDLMAPRTGGQVPGMGGRGSVEERAILPGYDKDVFGWYNMITGGQSMSGEIYNKLNPLVRLGVDIARQKDWKDQPFVRPDPTLPQWLADYFQHAINSIDPISMQRFMQGEKKGSGMGVGEEIAGIRQAPSFVQDPEGYQRWRHYHDTNEWKKVKKGEQRQKSQYGGTEQ